MVRLRTTLALNLSCVPSRVIKALFCGGQVFEQKSAFITLEGTQERFRARVVR